MREVAEQIFEQFCVENDLVTCKITSANNGKNKRRIADYLTIVQDSCIIVEVKEKQIKACTDECHGCDEHSVCNARADREIAQAGNGHTTIMDKKSDGGGLAFKKRLEDASEQIANTITDFKEKGIATLDNVFFMVALYNRVNIANYFTDHEVIWGLLRLLGAINNTTDKRDTLKSITGFSIITQGVTPKRLKIYYNPISNVHINPMIFAGLPIEIYILVQNSRLNNVYTFSFDWVRIDSLLSKEVEIGPSLEIADEQAINTRICQQRETDVSLSLGPHSYQAD